jgi:hypothetical protein
MGLIYNIIEDCSPYYIRFSHENISNIIDISLEESLKETFTKNFTHHKFSLDVSEKILNLCPITKKIPLKKTRVSLFVTKPGYYYRAHKDGVDNKISFNYTIKILDNKCVTSWYDDEQLKNYEIVGLDWKNKSREVSGFVKENHIPKKTMVALQGECILFNTDIYHDFDNRCSKNERIVLTLRPTFSESISFEDAKRILFGL